MAVEFVYTDFDTVIGRFYVVATGVGIAEFTLSVQFHQRFTERIRKNSGNALIRDNGLVFPLLRSVNRYLAGEKVLWLFATDLSSGTQFQQAVWRQTTKIPYGEVRTYGELAREIGKPSAARAVGQALAANPLLLIVPCHRVIGADGSLVGFGCGLELKRRFLAIEKGTGT